MRKEKKDIKNTSVMKFRLFQWMLLGLLFATVKQVDAQCGSSSTVNRWQWPTGDNWFMGDGVFANFPGGTGGITFSSVNTNNSERIAYEGTATISDNAGNLLYYSNGRKLWKADNTLIYSGLLAGNENGSSPGNPGGTTSSAVQGILFVKHPSNNDLMYIFTTDDALTTTTHGLNYWTLTLSTGAISGPTRLGAYRSTEQLDATFHSNGTDVWVATRESGSAGKPNFSKIYSYLISSGGLNTTPVISSVAPAVNTSDNFDYNWERGALKFSWNGARAATVNQMNSWNSYADAIVVYDFNNTTGQFTNAKSVAGIWGQWSWTGTTYESQYDCEFSPDSKGLYVSSAVTGNILWLDASLSTATNIYNSIKTVSTTGASAGDIKLGGDGKIYQATTGNTLKVYTAGDLNAGTGISTTTVLLPTGRTSGRCFSNMFIPYSVSPTVTLTNASTICSGASVQLTAGGATTYSWSPSTGLSATTGSTVTANPTVTTTYTVTGTTNGCSGTKTVTITVNSAPTITVSPSTAAICAGGNIQLTASGVSTYSWSPSTGLSATNIANPVASPTSTTTYTVTGTGSNGCTATATRIVTVNALPTLSVSPPTAAICSGANIQLTASGASTYSWSPSTGLSATNVSNPLASPSSTTTYTVTGTSASGCVATATRIVTVNALPTVSILPATATICSGGNIQLTANGASTYSWSPSTGLSAANVSNPTASPTATTTYTLTGTDNNGCVSTATKLVTVNSSPMVTVSPNAPSICSGANVQLTASGAITYSWSPSTGLSATNVANPVATPIATTTYIITGTNALGCLATANVTVSVNAKPTVAASVQYSNGSGSSSSSSSNNANRWQWTTGENWFFGDGVFLNFAGGTATPVPSAINTNFSERIAYEGTATISDDNGTLLYYSNGRKLWKADNTLVYSGLLAGNESGSSPGNPGGTTTSAVQGILFVKHPSNSDLMYIFTTDDALTSTTNGLNYWTLTLSTGVVAGPTRLGTYRTTEQLDATIHSNGTDIWVATRASGYSNKADFQNIYSYLITSSGVNSTPVVSGVAPSVQSSAFSRDWERGALKFSWDGSRAVTANDVLGYDDYNDAIVVYDFNSATGQFSNAKSVAGIFGQYQWSGATYEAAYDAEFAPDSKGLYVSFTANGKLIWLDASLTTASGIYNSIQTISITAASSGDIKLGGDGKLYQATMTNNLNVFSGNLNAGTGISQSTFGLPTGRTSGRCFSNMFIPKAGGAITLCSGGTAQLNAAGAVSYVWSPSTGLSASNIASPIATPTATTLYTVTGTDINGCTNTATATVLVGGSPQLTVNISDNTSATSCNGGVDISISGGTAPYTYSWKNTTNNQVVSTSQDITGICAGGYQVTVTDANGCSATATYTVNNTCCTGLTTVEKTNPVCGLNNGELRLVEHNTCGGGTTTGGTNGHVLTPGCLDQTIPSPADCAVYDRILTTANNVVHAGETVAVQAGYTGDVVIDGGTLLVCYPTDFGYMQFKSGTLYANVPTRVIYGLQMATGAGVRNIHNHGTIDIISGSYEGSLQNYASFRILGDFTVPASGNIYSQGDIRIENNLINNGEITNRAGINLNGLRIGGNYTNNGTLNNYCNVVVEGTYTENGIRNDDDATKVSGGGSTAGNNSTSSSSLCSVVWKNASGVTVGTSNTLSGLGAGTYTANITCSNGCNRTETVILTAPSTQPLAVQLASSTNSNSAICSGTAAVTVSGGTAPYTYEWKGTSQTSATATALCVGNYIVVVTDATGCKNSLNVTIGLDGGGSTDCDFTVSGAVGSPSCPAKADGTITITKTGTANVSYTWNTGSTNKDLTSVSVDYYSVLVQSGACKRFLSFNVQAQSSTCGGGTGTQCAQSGTMVLSQVAPAFCPSKCNAQLSAVITGITPVKYVWGGVETTTNSFNGACAQTYIVTAVDVNNCFVKNEITVGALNSTCPDPCNGSPVNAYVLVNANHDATPVVSGGNGTYSYLWSVVSGGTITNATRANQVDLANGTYRLVISSGDAQCKDTALVTVPNCGLTINAAQSRAATCPKSCDGEAQVSVTPNTNYSVLWDDKAAGTTLINACSGTHKVRIITSNGCAVEKTVNVTASGNTCPNETSNCNLSLAIDTQIVKKCFSDEGLVDIRVTGGKAPFTYTWTAQTEKGTETYSSDKEDLENPLPGIYLLNVKDVKGCTANITVNVGGSSSQLTASATSIQAACVGKLGSATVTVNGGVSPYNVVWSDNANGLSRSNLDTGYYRIKITDNVGCVTNAEVSMHLPVFTGKILASQRALCVGDEATLTAKVVDGYTYLWSGQGVPNNYKQRSLKTTAVGTFTLTYNQNGCSNMIQTIVLTRKDSCNVKSITCSPIQIEDLPSDTISSCIAQQVRSAEAYGSYRYREYVEEQKTQFKQNYINQILATSQETFTMKYTEKEQQYTLYYYDQAGNLVRTVMPSGVKTLSNTEATAAADDIVHNTSKVYTEHTLSTTYKYNSLNQLIAQDMPDHNKQDLWEQSTSSINLNGNTPVGVGYSSAGNGVLLSNATDHAVLYTTSDGGATWGQEANPGVGDILDIQKVDASNAYAVGTLGTFLKSTDGGLNWIIKSAPTQASIIKVYFTSVNNGIILAQNGSLWSTTDGGDNWSATINTLSVLVTGNITDASFDGSNLYVTSSDNTKGYIYKSTNNGVAWSVENAFKVLGLNTVVTNGSASFFAAGPAGSLFDIGAFGSTHVIRTDLNSTVVQLSNANGYKAVTTNGAVYTSSDDKAWTQVVPSSEGVHSLVNLNGKDIAVSGNKVAESSSWTFVTPSVLGSSTIENVRAASNHTLLIGTNNVVALKLNTGNFSDASGWAALTFANLPSGATIKDIWLSPALTYAVLMANGDVYSATVSGTLMIFSSLAVQTGVVKFSSNVNELFTIGTSNSISKTTDCSTYSPVTTLPSSVNILAGFTLQTSGSLVKGAATFTTGSVYKFNGTSWDDLTNTIEPSSLKAIQVNGSTDVFAAGSNGEIYRRNGSAWEYQSYAGEIRDFSELNISSSNVLRLVDGSDVYTYASSSLTKETTTSLVGSINKLSNDGTHVLATTAGGNVYSNTGTWTLNYTAPQALNAASAFGGNSDLVGGANGKIYRLVGSTWSAANDAKIQPLTAIAFDGNSAVAIGEQGTIITSTSGGSAWNVRYSGTTADIISVSIKGSKIVAGTTIGAVLNSSNAGLSWNSTIIGGFPVRSVKTANGNVVLALSGNNLYKSVNGGVSFAFEKALGAQGYSVEIDADGYGYIVGNAGMAYRITPGANTTTFVYTSVGTDTDISDDKGTGIPIQDLRTVQFVDRLTGHITGVNGLVLKTTDGGEHWNTESNTGTGTPLLSLGDGENGSIINGNSVSKLLDRSMEFGTRNWYDELGRLVLSQNAKQFNIENYLTAADKAQVSGTGTIKAYSYTLFDNIGRIVEVGEVLTRASVPTAKHETQVVYNTLKSGFVANGVQREITKTYYDRAQFTNIQTGFTQENLRPRVASVTYQDKVGTSYDRATHYNYDVHGNVKNLIQEIQASGVTLKKRMDYDYDLVSGKVNYFYYQKGEADQFIHKYEYDGDNRIVKVFTSRDGVAWDRDAKYDYYAHGPLARTTIGEHDVENSTYAYTIQGWIKGVNGNSFSYALGYFNDGTYQDYQGIGGANNYTLSTAIASGNSLFNGNIATMASNTPQFASQGGANWVQQFEYDQLNRITASTTLAGANANTFKTGYTYDAGGNITSLQRYDAAGNQFDAMQYNYQNTDAGYKTNTNKLTSVDDYAGFTAVHTSDIDDQSSSNYDYDDIGNLIKDNQEQIASIEWTVYGKVHSVTRIATSTKPDLEFRYDAMGNRVMKIVKEKNGDVNTTFYVRDASGNVLAIYESKNGSNPALAEQYIYGSSRVGTYKPAGTSTSNTKTVNSNSWSNSSGSSAH